MGHVSRRTCAPRGSDNKCMKLETYTPTKLLRPFVKCFEIVECDEDILNTMLPDTSLIMGFRYKGITKYLSNKTENELPFAVLAGIRRSVQIMKDSRNTGNLLVIFNSAGANAFIKEPLHHMFGEVVSLNELDNFRRLGEAEDKLCMAASDESRIRIVEQFLISKLYDHKPDNLVSVAISTIRSYNGMIKIEDLAKSLFISLDAFEKKFRRAVGASPKQICNIVRMNTLIQNIENSRLTDSALEAGFYDQARFNKHFKVFTGQTPSEFLKNAALKDQ